jgi:hypothetical protein
MWKVLKIYLRRRAEEKEIRKEKERRERDILILT